MKKEMLHNISWHFIYRVLRLGLAFFVTAWMARYLGPEEYGLLVFSVATAELVMLFWTQGLKELVIEQYRKQGDDPGEFAASVFTLMVTGNLILLGVLLLIILFSGFSQLTGLMILICGIGILFRSFEAYELWFHSRLRISNTVKVQFAAQLVYMAANILLILNKAGVVWFAFTYALQLVVAGIGFLIVFGSKKTVILKWMPFSQIKWILISGSFMILAKLLHTSSYLIDRVLIEQLLDVRNVGLYTASMKLTTTWVFISASISLTYLPIISEINEKAKKADLFGTMFGWLTITSMVLTLLIMMNSGSLVSLVFGKNYQEAAPVLSILSACIPFLFYNEGIKNWLIIENSTGYYLLSMFSITCLSILLNLVLIPIYGLIGAGLSFLISWFFGGVLLFFWFKKTRPLAVLILRSVLFPFSIKKRLFKHTN